MMKDGDDDEEDAYVLVNLALKAKVSKPVMIWYYNDFLHFVLYDCHDEMFYSVWMMMWWRSRCKASLA